MGNRRPVIVAPDDGSDDRAVLRQLISVLVTVALLCVIVFGAVLVGPQYVDDLEEIEGQSSPSSEPPPTGDRNPNVTDPDDPGRSTYKTNVETVASDDVEAFVHAEVNERRAAHGLESLPWDGTIASVSRAHSYDMADRRYFAHRNPDGERPYDRFTDVDNYCRGYGENIAMTWVGRPVERPSGGDPVRYRTEEGLATGLVNQWMNSTEHRKAILEENIPYRWDRGGVGVYITDEGRVYATHNFCHEW